MRTNTKADFFLHAGRLQESEINFVFCERELYVGTASEQKTKSANNGKDSMSLPFFQSFRVQQVAPTSLCKGGKNVYSYYSAQFSHFYQCLFFLTLLSIAFISRICSLVNLPPSIISPRLTVKPLSISIIVLLISLSLKPITSAPCFLPFCFGPSGVRAFFILRRSLTAQIFPLKVERISPKVSFTL